MKYMYSKTQPTTNCIKKKKQIFARTHIQKRPNNHKTPKSQKRQSDRPKEKWYHIPRIRRKKDTKKPLYHPSPTPITPVNIKTSTNYITTQAPPFPLLPSFPSLSLRSWRLRLASDIFLAALLSARLGRLLTLPLPPTPAAPLILLGLLLFPPELLALDGVPTAPALISPVVAFGT
jgi:hypothetical protein